MILRKIVSRSPREILFRLRQETANLLLAAFPPSPRVPTEAPPDGLPARAAVIDALKGTAHAAGLVALARKLMRHEFPLLGTEIRTGPAIEWRRDYSTGRSLPPLYLRRIPYLDFERAGDHKVIWELNRHQHMVVLAQAFRLTGEQPFLDEVIAQIRSWLQQNPYQRGINWTSALEVAFRALSWTWVYHLAGESFPPAFRSEFLESLYRHGRHLEYNLSVYFSPNTHLLGEAVALHALGTLFPAFPRSRRWKETGADTVRRHLEAQVLPDGVYEELSTWYHVYALDFFLLHYILAGRPAEFRPPLERMASFLDAMLGSSRAMPLIGDDDGGRLFHPYGDRSGFGCATLATCAALFGRPEWLRHPSDLHEQAAWWLGPGVLDVQPATRRSASVRFPDSGLAVMASESLEAVIDAGPLAPGSAGHSHSDCLGLVLRAGSCNVLVDAGTFTYVADPERRNWFRGSAAHNTVRIDRRDQAIPDGPFRWRAKPAVETLAWKSEPGSDYLDARCSSLGFRHRRRVVFLKPGLMLVLDEVEGPEGEHLVERFWHSGGPTLKAGRDLFTIGGGVLLALCGQAQADLGEANENGWRSPAYGIRKPSPVILERKRTLLPVALGAAIFVPGLGADGGCDPSAFSLSLSRTPDEVRLEFRAARSGCATFGASGPPRIVFTAG